jgi:hypothetical protein
MHGHHKTKADVMGVVHIGWGTLDKRVREFAATPSAGLTPREFEAVAAAAEEQAAALLAHLVRTAPGGGGGVGPLCGACERGCGCACVGVLAAAGH